jgi:hypothetical protein
MHVVSLLNPLNNRNIARTFKGQETRMGIRFGQPPALAVLTTLLAALAAAAPPRAQAGQAETSVTDGYAYLSGFGEGVATVLASSAPAVRNKAVQGFNGQVTLKTYRQPGIELTTVSGGDKAYPASLVVTRAGYPLPLGLRVGATRDAVENLLGPLPAQGDKLVLKRVEGYGCDDPIVLSFRGKVLTQVAWTWESCND